MDRSKKRKMSDNRALKHPKYHASTDDGCLHSVTSAIAQRESINSVADSITTSTNKHHQEPPEHRSVRVSSSTTMPSSEEFTSSPLESLDDPLLSEIVAFIGPNHYRFVAMINRRFHSLHLQLYPQNTNTYINISTLNCATIVFDEMKYIKCYEAFYKGDKLCRLAIENGNLPLLKFFGAKQCPYPSYDVACHSAAANGHLHILLWLRENRSPWDENTFICAAQNGQLHVLQWLREIGCPWNKKTISILATNGHLQVLQWARENGCPWNHDTCRLAAANGHLHVLQWAQENGCPWDSNTLIYAGEVGNLNEFQWALENGCPLFEGAHTVHFSPNIVEWMKGHFVLSKLCKL